MKRFLTLLFAVLAIFPAIFFTACGKKDAGINMSRYFTSTVSYTLYGSSGTKTTTLDHFIGSKADKQNKYLSVTFTGDNAWIYKMMVEKIDFDVYSNIDAELQFNIRVTNLRNGDTDAYLEPKFRESIEVGAGKTAHISIPVNDYFESNSAVTTIVIELDGAQHYYANGQETGLKIDIINFKVYGNHDNI